MTNNNFQDQSKPLIFTGITPTGSLTIGHYFGVIKNLVDLQNDYNIIVMIADLHALTTISREKIDYKSVSREIASTLYACGLSNKNCKIFIQSEISEHLELSYFLSSYCSTGKINNMIQYKEKSKDNNASFSLLYYPILMASDILLYDADLVIVGKDQKQHLEFTKYLANKFNIYNENSLKIPNFFISKNGSKIMDLNNPLKKMSKTSKTSIFILENESSVSKKIMKSKTDSEGKIFFDEKNKPGISNLLTIYSCITSCDISYAENFFSDKDYFFLKNLIIEKVNIELKKITQKYHTVLESIDLILSDNCEYLKKIAFKKVKTIKKKISLWKTLK